MPQTDINSAVVTDNTRTDYSVDSQSTDGIAEQPETTWTNEHWTQYLGYYKEIPELRAAIDAKATWTVGKGFTADPETEATLNFITGWGKETFNTIIENAIRTMQIGGDAFCEIIRNEEGDLINLKTLDPSSIKIVVGRKGFIKRYEQISKVKNPNQKFQPKDIFHLTRNRVADEIHGVSLIESIENIILMRNEAMSDWKRVLHRNIDPLWIIHADTDDPIKIAKLKADLENVRKTGESWVVPKGVVVPELIATAQNASLSPLAWIELLNNYFFQAAGVPQIIVGGSQEFTEATAKIAYLAFEQTINEDQLFIKEQVWTQLGMAIELEFPASLENELLSDNKKDVEQGATQPNDITATMGGQR